MTEEKPNFRTNIFYIIVRLRLMFSTTKHNPKIHPVVDWMDTCVWDDDDVEGKEKTK